MFGSPVAAALSFCGIAAMLDAFEPLPFALSEYLPIFNGFLAAFGSMCGAWLRNADCYLILRLGWTIFVGTLAAVVYTVLFIVLLLIVFGPPHIA